MDWDYGVQRGEITEVVFYTTVLGSDILVGLERFDCSNVICYTYHTHAERYKEVHSIDCLYKDVNVITSRMGSTQQYHM